MSKQMEKVYTKKETIKKIQILEVKTTISKIRNSLYELYIKLEKVKVLVT